MNEIVVGARSSRLSKIQVAEVLRSIQFIYPNITFQKKWFDTTGDIDLTTSLIGIEKTDFFTKELDEAVAVGDIDIAVHSAKDLPEILREDLTVAALTPSVDPRDVLVVRKGSDPTHIQPNAIIGVSSQRRIAVISKWKTGYIFRDIRGTIDARLAQLEAGKYDAIVIAEAALIRLNYMEYPRLYLPGVGASLQGQLAVVCHKENQKMQDIFSTIDIRASRCESYTLV